MRKISIFIYSLGFGGAERVVANLIPHLIDKFEIHLFVFEPIFCYDIPNNVFIHDLNISSKNSFLKFISIFVAGFKYLKICNKIGIDAHFVTLNRPIYSSLIARIFGLKGRLLIREASLPSKIYSKGLGAFANKVLIKLLYPLADIVVSNSTLASLELMNIYKIKNVKVLKNAVNLNFSKEPLIENFPFFISVGRLDEGKNHALLIRCISRLKALGYKKANLAIVGDGKLVGNLKELTVSLDICDEVVFYGSCDNVFRLLNSARCFVFASRFEGCSNAILEALMCEKCVISTAHKASGAEILDFGKYGILVDVDDENGMLNAMIRVLNEPELVSMFEKRARFAIKDYDAKVVCDELIKLLFK